MGRYGAQIEKMQPRLTQAIIYRAQGDGCCYKFATCTCECCECLDLRGRTYLWVTEAAMEQNTPIFAPCLCRPIDLVHKTYLDMPPFDDCCFGCCQVGVATQKDFMYLAYCIPFGCIYDCFCKPCFGQYVSVTPCSQNREGCCKGDCCFKLVTRCCPCLSCPVACCLKDADTFKRALNQQITNLRHENYGGTPIASVMDD